MKKILSLMAAMMMAVSLVACGSSSSLPEGFMDDSKSESSSTSSSASESEKVLDGRLGDTLHTMFFDFSVDSAQFVEEKNGYTPAEGNTLLDTVITIKNTYGQEIPMSTYDFQAQWEDQAEEAYAYQPEELTGEDVMPLEFNLKRGETVTYHVVFEVPAGSKELSISTMEYYTENGVEKEGDAYFVYFEL